MSDIRESARWLAGQLASNRDAVKALSAPQLGNSSIEAGKVEEYDIDGTLVAVVGEQFDGTHAAVTLAGPVPPEPAPPTVTTGAGQAEVRWSGKFAGDALSPMDFSHVAVHAAREDIFDPDSTTQRATITGESGDAATILLDSGVWTFVLVAVSKAGKWSDPSDPVSAEVADAIADTDLQDRLLNFDTDLAAVQTSVNGKNTITNATVDAAPATPGTTVGDRWQKWSTLEIGGKLLASWRWSGTVWIPEIMDPTYLPLVDIGQGTFGTLAGSRLTANSVSAQQIIIGDFQNLALGSDFENMSAVPWNLSANHVQSTGNKKTGTASLKLMPVTNPASPAKSNFIGDFRVREGEEWYFSYWALLETSFDGDGNSKVRISATAGSASLKDLPYNAVTKGTWQKVDGSLVVPAGVTTLYVALWNTQITGNAYIDDFQIRRKAEGQLLVDGVIDGKVVRGVTVIGSEVKTSETTGAVTARMGPQSVWDPVSVKTQPGIGFSKIGTNDAYPAGMYSTDGSTLFMQQSNTGGAGGSYISLGANNQDIYYWSFGVQAINSRGTVTVESTTGSVNLKSPTAINANGKPIATTEFFAPLQPSGWTVEGDFYVDRAGQNGRSSFTLKFLRAGAAISVPAGSYTTVGIVGPSVTRAVNGVQTYTYGVISGGAAPMPAVLFYEPSSGTVKIKPDTTITLGTGWSFTLSHMWSL